MVTFDAPGYTLGALTLQSATGVLQGGNLAVTSGVTLTAATVLGPYALIAGGASQATGLTLGGGAVLYNRGAMTQAAGAVEIGTSKTSRARIVNLVGAQWNDADNSGVTQGTGAGGWFVNRGAFTASAGRGVALIDANFFSNGALGVAAGGTVDFNGPHAMLSGTIGGGGLVKYGAAVVATLGALTVTATSQTNYGVVHQVGTMTLSGAQTITSYGAWNFDGDVSMLVGAGDSAAVKFLTSSGLIVAKTAGTGVSLVGASAAIGGDVNIASGTLEFAGATSVFTGSIYGAGTLEIAAGAAEFEGRFSPESISVAHLVLAGGTTSILGGVTVSGDFAAQTGSTLALSVPLSGGYVGNGVLHLAGTAELSGLNVTATAGSSNPCQLVVETTATVSGLTIGGVAELFDRGVVTQTGGDVILGDTLANDGAFLTIANGGVWNITDASGIGLGADPYSRFSIGYNNGFSTTPGLLEKSGAGVSVISPVVNNNSSNVVTSVGVQYEGLEVTGGTLELQNGVGGTGTDNIVGAGTLAFDREVLAGQTVSFFGSGGTLEINNISNFHAAIVGFDIVGGGDTLLIGLNMQFTGATETATAATLNFAAGVHAFSLELKGDYRGGTFTAQPVAGFGVKVTY